MALPFFYFSGYSGSEKQVMLDEETSRHIIQVLRMKEGGQLNLTDGKGNLLTCEITATGKRSCTVEITGIRKQDPGSKNISVAISLLKNPSRFEWFLEKATEIGVREIIPLICDRTEKEKFRFSRMNAICISAMLQSQQGWLPLLQEPVAYNQAVKNSAAALKLIAHCDPGDKPRLTDQPAGSSVIILIGPEGDFTPAEIELALQNGFRPVSLGETRLRTETAGVVAAVLLANS